LAKYIWKKRTQEEAVMAKIGKYTCVALSVLAASASVVVSAGETRGTFSEQRVHFARGAHGATVRGQVSREQAMFYIVGAKAGQLMTVRLDGDAKTAFDLSGPKDSSGQAMASSETEWGWDTAGRRRLQDPCLHHKPRECPVHTRDRRPVNR
jgi:hypothetical protein